MIASRQLLLPAVSPSVRLFQCADTSRICSWVQSRQQLSMVSGDQGERLTAEILQSWLMKATASIVLEDSTSKNAVGFCTLSRLELPNMPSDCIELCHVLVDPQQKYLFVTSRLLHYAKALTRDLGYRVGCARVVPSNRWALALARYHKSDEFTDKETWAISGFRWFRLYLTEG